MAFEEILYDVADRVATITLNRPAKLNAWTPTMEKEVRATMDQADRDDTVRVIVLTGAGRGFCAGADMGALEAMAGADKSGKSRESLMAEWLRPAPRPGARPDFQKTYSYFPSVSKPVIGAINGPTAGLGMVISLYCDVRIASSEAKFSTAFSRRGLIAEHGISWMLPRLVGLANALDLLYSARMIDAAEAWRIGLVNLVVPPDRLIETVKKYAAELATAVSPRSLRVIKKLVYDGLFQNLGEAIDAANAEMIKSFACDDFKEGVAHFIEKRPPAFTGT